MPTEKIDYYFVLVLLSMHGGVPNMISTPLIMFNNGRGFFLLLYCVFFALLTWPMSYLQCLLGQHFQGSASVNEALGFSPFARGTHAGVLLVFLYTLLNDITALGYTSQMLTNAIFRVS